jgi:hypothetical protein
MCVLCHGQWWEAATFSASSRVCFSFSQCHNN